jgi:SAUR family protein
MKMRRQLFSGKLFQRIWRRKLSQELGTTSSTVTYQNLNDRKVGAPIPKDVPKGHMVVYVGEQLRRYVIKISFLEHPLFQELLELAHKEYGFSGASGLCIPCDEDVFLGVIFYLNKQQEQLLLGCCQL